MSKPVIQKIVVGGVVIKENKVLILQRHENEDVYPGMWELPSGKREPLETSEAALIREVKEESGLDVEVMMPFSVFDYQIEKPEEIRDSTQVNFLAKPKGGEVVLSAEHQDSAWITADSMPNYNLTAATRQVIIQAFELLPKIL